MIVEPKTIINADERAKLKRLSLNESNFLQVPETFKDERRKKKKKYEIERLASIGKNSSISEISGASDALQPELMQML